MKPFIHLEAGGEPVEPYCITRPKTVRHTAVVHGFSRAWEVYIPKSYDGASPCGLVIYVHGAGGFNPAKVPWSIIAEKEGFLVAYPEAVEPWLWNIWNLKTGEGAPDDVYFLDFMITRLLEDYRIDPSRIYMQGNSMGDNMVSTYAYEHGDRLAAIAPTSGPTLPSVQCDGAGNYRMTPLKPQAVARLHGDRDTKCGLPSTYGFSKAEFEAQITPKEQRALRSMMDQMQKDQWNLVNQADAVPQLYFDEYMNLEMYQGEQGCLYFYSVVNGEHSPDLDFYDILWNQYFSGWKRVAGELVWVGARETVTPDYKAAALSAGADRIYQEGRVTAIHPSLRSREIDGIFYTPVRLMPRLVRGMGLEEYDPGRSAILSYKEHRISVARGQQCMLVDGSVVSLSPAVCEQGELLIPAVRFVQVVCGFFTAQRDQVVYMTDHPVNLTGDGAMTIQVMLGTRAKPVGDVAFENQLKERIITARNEK